MSHRLMANADTTSARSRAVVGLLIPALLVLGSCSSESALCTSIDSLRSDLEGLKNVNVVDDGIDALTTQIDAVKASFADVKQEAGNAFSSDIDAVEAALGDVETVVQQVQGGSALTDVAPQAVAAVSALVTAVDSLIQTAQEQECG